MIKRKYRILELHDGFYPQEKKWFNWRYIDGTFQFLTDLEKKTSDHKCKDLATAKYVIELRIEYIKKREKFIVHKYIAQ